MDELDEPPCGEKGHERGWMVDEEREIWYCPDCGQEIWLEGS